MEKPFKQLWRELCKHGWKPKPPTGLNKDHCYIRPGETALIAYARPRGWLQFGVLAGSTVEEMVTPSVTASRTSAVVSEPGDMHSEVSA
ncbi:hypothetical protein PHYPSEUDO_007797 [Phytophthora pseudosyringae]|uniref:Uncharacterized protein n=1 Tax=Phytophthora pseudosyringae TaxID=221518 RepID=A0A8T1VG85_9STRA|nr:hypothetical protein PHYPSEUDO_007797 [Phytophthora pseudosyringae]